MPLCFVGVTPSDEAGRARKRFLQIEMWLFAIAHLVAAVIYYKFNYDPEGTYALA
jgi:hypothetical protein